MKLLIINGPNLNLLGKREPEIYGDESFEDYIIKLKKQFENTELTYFQSNIEGEIIDKIQEVGFDIDGIIINGGAYSHTSIAIADAIKSVPCKVVEVHISNVFKREAYRHFSHFTENCEGLIVGFGLNVYLLAIYSFIKK